jgi:alpha-amylase/alpha-mannosidase (GH57 family)
MALYIHNHQPTGNFDEVFEHAYKHAYLPLLATLMKHRKIKFGIHNSGILMEWIAKKHPEFCEMLKEAAKNGQADILTSAYGEPILTFIPAHDVIEQIKHYTDYLFTQFDYQARGLWLTERIWEPQLAATLHDAGITYTLLDDTHFLYAGLTDEDLYSYYITEHEGKALKVFPISMKLRYLIPFHPIKETVSFLRQQEKKRENTLKTLGDDGEKFGVWPGTYDWVHTKGWLDEFLSMLENETNLETVFLHERADEPPAGRIYLPTSSYEEMGEWVLPPARSAEYEKLKKKVNGKYYQLIHGGYFRNFLRKYPEANMMHKRMLHVSSNVSSNKDAKLALWRGQCSCAYWHGIFGGLYLPHLREAIYSSLIAAENRPQTPQLQEVDFDVDGEREIVFSNRNVFAVIKPKTACFIELDDRERKQNLLNYLGRRPEKYHHNLSASNSTNEVKSIHETFRSKEQELQKYLIYDKHERGFGIDRMLHEVPTAEEFRNGFNIGTIVEYEEYKVRDRTHMQIEFNGPVTKSLELMGENGRTIRVRYDGDLALFGFEFSLGIFQNDLRLNNNDLHTMVSLTGVNECTVEAKDFMPITMHADVPFDVLTYPIETVSSSEAGFERIFQGVSALFIFRSMPTIDIRL